MRVQVWRHSADTVFVRTGAVLWRIVARWRRWAIAWELTRHPCGCWTCGAWVGPFALTAYYGAPGCSMTERG